MDLTLVENVAVAVLYGRAGITNMKLAAEQAYEILEFTGLAPKAKSLPSRLALEDRKRLEIARALGSNPR